VIDAKHFPTLPAFEGQGNFNSTILASSHTETRKLFFKLKIFKEVRDLSINFDLKLTDHPETAT
jgi:hypothetical protein